jgi:hypothetical protein
VTIQIAVFWVISDEHSISIVREEGSKFAKAVNYAEGKINWLRKTGLDDQRYE